MTKLLNYKSYSIFFLLIIAVLFLRMGNINFTNGQYLWAEDGNIFINQALSLGLESIFHLYAGYIHLYPRLISIFAVQFNLFFLPVIFFIAWIGAVTYSSFVVFRWIYIQTNSIVISMIVPLLVLLQPNSGEIFFTITNAQWFLSLALIVLLIDKEYRASYKNFVIFILLGLTGPFSALVLPILFFNIVFKKDLKENYIKYMIVLATAIIQIYFMMQSDRVGGVIDANILHWLKSFYIFITFDSHGFFALLSLLIWVVFFVYVVKFIYDVCKQRFTVRQLNGFLILIALVIIYLAGLWSTKQDPLALNPLGGGARYFFIPYSLFLISLPLLIKHNRVLYLLFFLIFVIDMKLFTVVNRPSLNFKSFIWFSKYSKNLNIPINPQWGTYPGWHIDIKNKIISNKKEIYSIDLKNVAILNGIKLGNKISATNNDLQLSFELPTQCNKSPQIGVEIALNKESNGWSQIFYRDSSSSFTEEKSLRRYYNKGALIMQYAFRNNNIQKVRIDPTEKEEIVFIKSIKVFCDAN